MSVDWGDSNILRRVHQDMLEPVYKKIGYPPMPKDIAAQFREVFERMIVSEHPEDEYRRLYDFYDIEDNALDYLKSVKEKIEEDFKIPEVLDEEFNKLRQKVIYMLAAKERAKATELVVQYLLDKHKFYSIRNNVSPEIWVYDSGVYKDCGISLIKEVCREIFLNAYTTHLGNQVIAKIEADTFIDAEDFFMGQPIDLVPVENGLLDIFKKELKPFSSDYIFFNKLPVIYHPRKTCPNIIKHFETVLKNKEDIIIMQELFGDLLRKEYKYEKGFMFNGFGRNGKGKTLSLIKAFLGDDNCCSVSLEQLENDQYAVGNLFGKMANLAGDLAKTALKTTGRFKNCVGRDSITANRKNKNHINFVNYAKMLFACNDLPITYDNTDGFWTKWILFDFPYKFVDGEVYEALSDDEKKMHKINNPDIIHNLTTESELSGLLNWALVGLSRLDKQKKFSDTKTSDEIKKAWIRKSDSLKAFCMDYVVSDYDSYISKVDFRFVYSEYCRVNKIRACNDKYLKLVLAELYGASEERKRIGEFDNRGNRSAIFCWVGIDFNRAVQGVSDVQGVLYSLVNLKFPREVEIGSTANTPDTEEESHIGNEEKQGVMEEFITSDKELIHQKCFYCASTPCVAWTRTGRPACKRCQDDPNLK